MKKVMKSVEGDTPCFGGTINISPEGGGHAR